MQLLSEKEAEELIEEYYEIAETLWYLSNDEFDINNNQYPNPMEIRNYEEVIDKYISKSYKDRFSPALLMKKDGKYYIQISGFAQGYDNLKFEDIVIKEDEISCKVVFSLYVGNELMEDNIVSDFSVVLEDDEWKIAEYSSDYTLYNAIYPEEAAAANKQNEKMEVSSDYGQIINNYLYKIWAEPEVYKDNIAEFDDVKSAPKEYLAICSAYETWHKNSNDINNAKATVDDFNKSLEDLFGENANGLLTKENIESVPFVVKNDDGITYRFAAIEGSETSKAIYSVKNIEREDNKFYVELYEYKTESELSNTSLNPGEGTRQYVYNKRNELLLTLIVRAVQNGNTISYIAYTETGEEIGTSKDVKEYILSHLASDLSVRKIELELEKNDEFIMINNKLEK